MYEIERFLGFFEIFWDFWRFFGIFWDFWDWRFWGFIEIFWDFLRFFGIFWDFFGIFWKSVRDFFRVIYPSGFTGNTLKVLFAWEDEILFTVVKWCEFVEVSIIHTPHTRFYSKEEFFHPSTFQKHSIVFTFYFRRIKDEYFVVCFYGGNCIVSWALRD